MKPDRNELATDVYHRPKEAKMLTRPDVIFRACGTAIFILLILLAIYVQAG
jgi:hypothetical protein